MSPSGEDGAVRRRWRNREGNITKCDCPGAQPATDFLPPYMVIPFARTPDEFVDDVRTMGNALHRLRLPRRVQEAAALAGSGLEIEAFDLLGNVSAWIREYQERNRSNS